MSGVVPRVGGRLLLFNPDGRVLLIHEHTEDGSGSYWLTPGGGVEPGETPQQAAVRETYEETGIEVALADAAPLAHMQQRRWSWGGVTYDQADHFYVAAAPPGLGVRPVGLTEAERATRIGHRWWSVEELRASNDVFVPPYVADLLAEVAPRPRVAGRVLLLDDQDRVLLLEHFTDVGARSRHWITPGGGVEPGESPARAATRELFEETGVAIELGDDAPPDHRDSETFGVDGRWYVQSNHYYVARVAADTPLRVAGIDEVERALLIGERWWTVPELRATGEVIYPSGLADLLDRLLSSDPARSA